MSMKDRIKVLEERARPETWADVSLTIVAEDGRLNPADPLPDETVMVVRSGSPGKPGKTLFMEGS